MGQGHNMRVERAACTRLAAVVLGVLTIAALAGCAAPVQRQAPELRREASKVPRIVVMPLDVELAQLTAGGMDEPPSGRRPRSSTCAPRSTTRRGRAT
jgi:hypothetical protein